MPFPDSCSAASIISLNCRITASIAHQRNDRRAGSLHQVKPVRHTTHLCNPRYKEMSGCDRPAFIGTASQKSMPGRCSFIRLFAKSGIYVGIEHLSALGQKRTLQRLRPMSAIPPKADIRTGPRPRQCPRQTRAAGSGVGFALWVRCKKLEILSQIQLDWRTEWHSNPSSDSASPARVTQD